MFMQHACLMICNVLSISISICYSCFLGVRMCCLLAFDRFSNPSSRIHETVELVTDVVDKNGLDKKCWMLQTQLYVNHSFLYSGGITSHISVRSPSDKTSLWWRNQNQRFSKPRESHVLLGKKKKPRIIVWIVIFDFTRYILF